MLMEWRRQVHRYSFKGQKSKLDSGPGTLDLHPRLPVSPRSQAFSPLPSPHPIVFQHPCPQPQSLDLLRVVGDPDY